MNDPGHWINEQQDNIGDYVLGQQIGFLLRRAHQRATSIFQSVFEEKSLTPQQFAVLARLMEVGEVTQNKLGRLVDMDPASMQGVIKRLKQQGLVYRTRDPHHKRRLKVQLTVEGQDLVKSCFPLGQHVSRLTLQPLDSAAQKDLVRLLKKLNDGES